MEQSCDDAPDLTPAMSKERISRPEQTVVLLSISRHNITSNNTLFIVRVYCTVYPALAKNQLSAPPHTLQKQRHAHAQLAMTCKQVALASKILTSSLSNQ